ELVGRSRLGKRRRSGLRAWELAHAAERDVERVWGRAVSRANALEELARCTALAAAVFFLALAGIPVGILSGGGGRVVNFLTAAAPVMLVYFPLVIAGSSLARGGGIPAYPAMWAGNAVLLVAGVFLMRRVMRR
ncbi:MAG: LptF/LptG family permease, partial [Planctomycetota bacterium]